MRSTRDFAQRFVTPRPEATSADLVRRSAVGDQDAFRELVERHEGRVYRLALRLLGDPRAAEETAQDAFVRLYGALDSFRGDSRLSTWLHRVTVNLCRDEQRRAQRAERFVELDVAEPRLVVVSGDEAGELERAESSARVEAALARIPEAQREAIVLRYLGELSYAEIAEATGVSANTVASRVYRGLERLGGILGGEADEKEVS